MRVSFEHERTVTPLCEIMERNRSDKGSTTLKSWHNYTTVYHHLFQSLRDSPIRIFELGLGTNYTDVVSNMGANGRPGASHQGWQEYFPKASIQGADIDRRVLFQTDRIRTYYCDQTNPEAIRNLWSEPDLQEPFDIIIDDGLHTLDANACLFEHSIHKLKKGGYYIIEDLMNVSLPKYERKIEDWKLQYPHLTFQLYILKAGKSPHDNNLLVIHFP